MEEAWDLQAVVSHFPNNEPMPTTATTINHDDNSHPQQDPFDFFSSVVVPSDLKELDDDQDFYKPLSFGASSSNNVNSNEVIPGNFYISSSPYLGGSVAAPVHLQQFQQQPQIPKQQLHPASIISSTSSLATSTTTTTTKSVKPKFIRRKVQQKRLVCKVPAEGGSSDMWAWRKYGQKPIKGSPYPRGYYKCSSSKGCMAKKLVERSYSEPSMFLITYKAEHNHPIPTHRNSLAGSTRISNNSKPNTSATSSTSATTNLSGVSSMPTTHALMESSIEAADNKLRVQQQQQVVKQEIKEEYGNSNLMSNEELFMGLEVLNYGPTMVSTTSGSFMRF